MIHQVHLKKPGCSGRGVRYRILKPSELDHNEMQAARGLEKDDTVLKYELDVLHMGLYMMVTAYTEPTQKDLNGSAKWIKADPDSLETQWNELFTTKDTVLLKAIYKREHGTSNAEVEEILSGKVDVLEE